MVTRLTPDQKVALIESRRGHEVLFLGSQFDSQAF